jgi:hypothetical protein
VPKGIVESPVSVTVTLEVCIRMMASPNLLPVVPTSCGILQSLQAYCQGISCLQADAGVHLEVGHDTRFYMTILAVFVSCTEW